MRLSCAQQRRRRHVVALVWFFICFLQASAARSYRWKTWVDKSSGMAESLEESLFPIQSQWQQHQGIKKVTSHVFAQYPEFLSTARVSFGLLRTTKGTKRSPRATKEKKDQFCLKDTIFGLNLLTFGPPRHGRRRSQLTTRHPMVGGILVSSLGTGCIEVSVDHDKNLCRISSRITPGYYPALILGARGDTVHPWRLLLYRSTQAQIHAYVMWRFHRHCFAQFTKGVSQ